MKFPLSPAPRRPAAILSLPVRRPRVVPHLCRLWFALAAVSAAGVVAGVPRAAHAQVPPPPAPTSGPTVRAIEIQYAGPATVSRERILGNMRTRVGQPFNQQAVEDDIRNLYGTGDITNVRIFSEPQADGVKVIVIVQTRALVREIVIEGATRLKARGLKRKLTTKEGTVLNEEIVEQDRQKIVQQYQDRGFSDVAVQANVAYNEQAGNASVVFTVNEGSKSSLRRVVFVGNAHVTSRELRKAMKGTRGRTLIAFIDKSGKLDDIKLREDLESVREVYQNKGYIDAEIAETRTERVGKGDVTLTVVIREGAQYRVTTLGFEGNQKFTEAEIRRFLKMKEGTLYTPKDLKADVKTIGDYYGSRGYVDARIVPEGQPAGAGQVALRYRVDEGGISQVERVNIEGNTITKDKVIRRELAVAPGDTFNTVLVESSKKRLENLGYFQKVDTNATDTLVAGRKDLDVLVEEKKTGSLSFGAGFSSIDSLIGQVELSQGNFDILNWPTFTGGGQKFRLMAAYGVTRQDFDVSFTEPYFLDYRLSLGGSAFYHETSYVSNDYNQRNIGFSINTRRALTRYVSASLEYRLEDILINNVASNSTVLQQETGPRLRSGLRGGLSFDSRDSVFLTRRGARVDLSPFIAGGPLGGDTDIYGFSLTGSRYFSFPLDTILLFNGEIATVDTFAGGDRVPVYDRLYLGGANNLRGYGFRAVGVKDFNGVPVGGRTMARFTSEFTYPVIERVRGAVFYDAGFVNKQSWNFQPDSPEHQRKDFPIDPNRIDNDPKTPDPNPTKNDLRNTLFGGGFMMDIGIGVRLDLPIGPIRLDYGYPLLDDGFNRRATGKFNFNVGYQF